MHTGDEKILTVSVVIPAYNAGKYLARAIDSVLAQTRAADEIIIVDDGSTDNTRQVAMCYGDRLRYIYQQNAGGSSARNTGIMAASGEYIAFLDADDEWLPKNLQMQTEILQRRPDLDWCYGNYIIKSEGFGDTVEHKRPDIDRLLKDNCFLESYLHAFSSGIPTRSSVMVAKRSALAEAGMFLVGQTWAQDADLAFRLAYRQPRTGYVAEPVCIYHFCMPGSVTETNRFRVPQRCDFIDRHIRLSAAFGRESEFKPCAVSMLYRWIRELFSADRAADAAQMIKRFGNLLPTNLKIEAKIRTQFPLAGPPIMNTYFAVKNYLLRTNKNKRPYEP